MEINGENEHGSKRGVDIPVTYLRLLAPPLQLLSAAVWQVVQQGRVDRFGMLEEFVTMVTELVPELMCYSQRAQLIMGLRARLVLEMCQGEEPVDMQTIQPHLDRIKAPVSTAKDHHVTINQVEESEVNFVELVHSILEDPSERKYFFEEIFPVYFGPKFDEALEILSWEFISRLDKLLPVPDFTQLTAVLGETPTFLDDCLQSFLPPEDIKAVLTHHRNLGHLKEKDPQLLPMDNCILSSLSLPPGTKAITSTSSCSSPVKGSTSPEHAATFNSPFSLSSLEHSFKRSMEAMRQGLSGKKDTGVTQLQGRSRSSSQEKKKQSAVGAHPSDETIDLTTPNETEDVLETNESCRVMGRVLRKRKQKEVAEIPSKRPVDKAALLFFDSSIDDENSGESPLISILGEYTDSQENPLPVVSDKLPWSEEETLHLLDIWGKDSVQRALKGCLKNRHIFTQIAQKMAERGYVRSVEQCQTRIKRLKKSFRQKNRGGSKQEGKFYEKLQSILHSPVSSAVPEVTFDVEEVVDEDDADNDLQFVSPATQPEKATRSAPWTDFETMTLINMWGEAKMQQELRGTYKNSRIFSLISKKLSSHGYSRTPEQCQTRLKRLKTNFRQCYQNNLREQEQNECKFYNELGQFLVKDFTPVPQMNKMTEEYDDDFSAFSQQDTESVMEVQDDKKKVPWSDKETIILLEIWGDEQVQQTLKRYPHNGHLFTQISEKLATNGFYRSPEQCLTRIKRLKTSYRLCQESLRSSGNDKVDFKFYDLLEQILDKQPSTSSTMITDSIEISEDSNEESLSEMGKTLEQGSAEFLWTDTSRSGHSYKIK